MSCRNSFLLVALGCLLAPQSARAQINPVFINQPTIVNMGVQPIVSGDRRFVRINGNYNFSTTFGYVNPPYPRLGPAGMASVRPGLPPSPFVFGPPQINLQTAFINAQTTVVAPAGGSFPIGYGGFGNAAYGARFPMGFGNPGFAMGGFRQGAFAVGGFGPYGPGTFLR